MSRASARQAGSSWSASTTRFTKPQSAACSALRKLPVSDSSLARKIPIKRGSFWLSPQPGRIPTRACVSANRPCGEASSRSQASATSNPPVIATPLIAPMIGFGHASIARVTSSADSIASLGCTCSRASPPSSFRSIPAQNALPAPVRITAPTASSRETSANAATIALRSSLDSAFIDCGRLSVSVAIDSLFSTSSTSDIAYLPKKERGPKSIPALISTWNSRLVLELLHFLRQLRHRLEEIGHQPVVGDLEDRRLGILVDGDDRLGVLHAGQMLDGSGNADRDVQRGRHHLAGLSDLQIVRHESGVDGGAARAHRRTERLAEWLENDGEVLAVLQSASARDHDRGLGQHRPVGLRLVEGDELRLDLRRVDVDGDLLGLARGAILLGGIERRGAH